MSRSARWLALVALAVAALGFPALPQGSVAQDAAYLVVAAGALALVVLGVRANRPRRGWIWVPFVAGLGCRFAGDVGWITLEQLLHAEPFPSVADAVYLAGYPLMALGLVLMVRARQPGHHRAATLDAAILATGATILAAVFIIAPTVADTSQDALSRTISTSYPVGDLLLLVLLARLWTTMERVLYAYRLLGVGLLFLLAGDLGYDAVFLTTGLVPDGPWLDLAYLLAYLCIAAATLHPSMRALSERADDPDDILPRPRLVAMTVGSMLAPTVLLFEGLHDRPIHWQVLGPGSMLLSALVLARMGGLLAQVGRQSGQLAALARDDGLTGLPNRRTWDHELTRATAAARENREPLSVALLDLDHFKQFNDAFGHAGGDRLLGEATRAWRATLPDDVFLARYGGEEFSVLFRGRTTAAAYDVVAGLARVTPSGQTFSAGLAGWDGVEEPAALVARADARLYEAKRAGRARIQPAPAAGR